MAIFTSVSTLLLTVFVLSITALLSHILYNIYLHPLSSYPGPKLYAATRLPLIRKSIQGHSVKLITQLHEQYGPVVRIAPNELSYITATAWKTIYGHRGAAEEMPKNLKGAGLTRPPNGQHGVLTADRENHARMRRLISHAFSEKALREQEGFLQQYVDLLIKGLKENVAEPQNLVSWYNWTTFDIIGDLSYGEPFSCLANQYPDPWITGLFTAIKIIPYIQALTYYGLLFILKYVIPRSILRARNATQARQKARLDKRLARGLDESRKDFLSYILRHNHDLNTAKAPDDKSTNTVTSTTQTSPDALTPGEIFTNAQVQQPLAIFSSANTPTSSLLIIAGSETTATLLSGATYHILRNPLVHRRLVSEIRTAFPSSSSPSQITLSRVSELRYLSAVLDETLRIYPPAPVALPRIVPKGGAVVDGRYVPEGTTVGVHQYAAYHSARNFVRPSEFAPERWMSGVEAEAEGSEWRRDDRAVFNPFSVGPRNCIGRNLAYAEMRLVMARILWTFDLALDESTHPEDVSTASATSTTSSSTTGTTEDGKEGEQGPGEWQEKQRVFLIWEKRPLMVKLTVREGLGEEERESGGGYGGGSGAAGSGSGSGVMPMGPNVAESVAWSA